jgi:Fe-S cluster assembly iron-binding protein IscA
MQITNEAREQLKQILQDQNASGIRVYFNGFG